jgi:hypothetical protein
MGKTDFRKKLKTLYAPRAGTFSEVEVPALDFVKVDGRGDPNVTQDYARAVKALYRVSYAMKFAARDLLDRDYVVPPLEGLWWADDPAAFVARRKEEWHWTMMIMVPDFVTRDMFDAAARKTRRKGPLPPGLRLERCNEGLSLQTMHIGGYDAEAPTLAQLHDQIMPERGLTFNGPHHEIYISDPRRTDASRLKTVLRQPVRPQQP